MDQQSIAMYLGLKDSNAVDIHNDLVATLKGEAKSSSTVTYLPPQAEFIDPKDTPAF
jgi:hypothetical protein